jgi:hypothetical protein
MSDISHKFYIWPLGPLVSVVDFEPKTGQKRKTKKKKFYQAIRNQNQILHGFNPESTIEASGRNFARDFE